MKYVLLLALAVALAMAATGTASATSTQPGKSVAWCNGSQTWQSVRGSLDEPAIRVKARVARVYYASSTRGRSHVHRPRQRLPKHQASDLGHLGAGSGELPSCARANVQAGPGHLCPGRTHPVPGRTSTRGRVVGCGIAPS